MTAEGYRTRWWRWRSGFRSAPDIGLADDLVEVLRTEYPLWNELSPGECERLHRLTAAFIARTRWEAARGFLLDDRVRVLVAAQASLLLLGLDIDEYPATPLVIVHRDALTLRGPRPTGIGGVHSASPRRLEGQAHYRGPVVLSWAAVQRDLRSSERGRNVVYHEFAHQLDMLDGVIDGTPPIGDPEFLRRWAEIFTGAYERLRDGESDTGVLRSYGATNPGEFFAVATETFFTTPLELEAHEPGLYAELSGFYGQDPARRRRATGQSDGIRNER